MSRRPMLLPALVCLLAPLLLASCGAQDDDPAAGPGRPSASASVPPPASASSGDPAPSAEDAPDGPTDPPTAAVPDLPARRVLAQWLRTVRANGTGRFTIEGALPGLNTRQSGVYSLRPYGYRFVQMLDASPASASVTSEVLLADDRVYFTVSTASADWNDCYLSITLDELDQVDDLPGFEVDSRGGLPFALQVVLAARGLRYAGPDKIRATTSLSAALGAISTNLPTTLKVPADDRTRVPIVIDLVEGEVVGWSSSPQDVFRAAVEAG